VPPEWRSQSHWSEASEHVRRIFKKAVDATCRCTALRRILPHCTALHCTGLVWLRSGIRRRLRGIEYAKARR
jgi:hypothetical protein